MQQQQQQQHLHSRRGCACCELAGRQMVAGAQALCLAVRDWQQWQVVRQLILRMTSWLHC
jgi:hypothetical protein